MISSFAALNSVMASPYYHGELSPNEIDSLFKKKVGWLVYKSTIENRFFLCSRLDNGEITEDLLHVREHIYIKEDKIPIKYNSLEAFIAVECPGEEGISKVVRKKVSFEKSKVLSNDNVAQNNVKVVREGIEPNDIGTAAIIALVIVIACSILFLKDHNYTQGNL